MRANPNFKYRSQPTLGLHVERKHKGWKDIEIVESPFPYKNLPDGTYEYRTLRTRDRSVMAVIDYCLYKGVWYKGKVVVQPTYVSLMNWETFPRLSDAEYKRLKSMFKYLSKEWQTNVKAYTTWCEINRQRRRLNLLLMRIRRTSNDNRTTR